MRPKLRLLVTILRVKGRFNITEAIALAEKIADPQTAEFLVVEAISHLAKDMSLEVNMK